MNYDSMKEYWEGFREYVKKDPENAKYVTQQASPQTYYDVAIGSSLAHIAIAIAEKPRKENLNVQVKIYFTASETISAFDVADEFNKYKETFEKNVGKYNYNLDVERHPTFVFSTKGDVSNRSNWNTYYEWQLTKLLSLINTIKELRKQHSILSESTYKQSTENKPVY